MVLVFYSYPAKSNNTGASLRHSNANNNNLRPASVLEVSLSNESCLSSSLEIAQDKLHADFMDCSYNQSRQLEPDADLLDYSTSLTNGRPGLESSQISTAVLKCYAVLTLLTPD